jgi:hypothetical protein
MILFAEEEKEEFRRIHQKKKKKKKEKVVKLVYTTADFVRFCFRFYETMSAEVGQVSYICVYSFFLYKDTNKINLIKIDTFFASII